MKYEHLSGERVDAMFFDGSNADAFMEFDDAISVAICDNGSLLITTYEGGIFVHINQWVVQYVDDALCVFTDKAFNEAFEEL